MNTKRTVFHARGFTLIEMMVAVALFSVVMLVSVGALLSLVHANRKAQALHSVIDNLNIVVDSMVRAIRMGSTYHCGQASAYTDTQDCDQSGDTVFAFEAFDGDPLDITDQWVYSFESDENGIGRIYKSEQSGDNAYAITSPSVSIESMRFYVIGTTVGCSGAVCDTVQPKVVITIKGTAGADNVRTRTAFSIQATAVQRILDL